MSKLTADTLLGEALSAPWMISEDGYAQILSILTRTNISPEAIAIREGDPVPRRTMTIRSDGTALIPVVGPIVRRADLFSRISGATDLSTIRDDLTAAADMGAVQRIMMVHHSPGGETTGISELAAYIRQIDAMKPIVAFAEGTMASASYYLGCAAREVIAAPMAVIGSIGVRMAIRKDPQGSVFEFVSSQSPKKKLDPETADGQASIQQLMDDLAAVFITDVAAYRGVSEETVLADFGQGGVFAAARAVTAGLVDRVETQESALTRLAASVPPSPAERAGTTSRSTFPSAAIAPEEHSMKTIHRAPESGAGAGGGGPAADAPDHTAAVTAAIAGERTRIAGVLTIARVPLATDVQSAIDGGHSVEAFALARARAEVNADRAGADAHLAAAKAAEEKNREAMRAAGEAPKPSTADASSDADITARIIANARAAGVPLAGGSK